MSWDLCIMRGSPRHFAERLDRLKPLDEETVRARLAAPPARIEVHEFVGDKLLWAGESVLVDFLLARSDDGVLRTIELGLTGTGTGDGYADDFEAVALALVELSEALGGRLYREPFDRSGRFDRAEIERMAREMRERAPTPPPPRRAKLLIDFSELTDEEAEAYLREHVARAAGRLASFRSEVAALGGSSEEVLDAKPRASRRSGRGCSNRFRSATRRGSSRSPTIAATPVS